MNTYDLLLCECVESYKNGICNSMNSMEDPSKTFSTRYLLNMSTNLSLGEITAILRAEKIREYGLSKIRRSEFSEGEILIDEAGSSYRNCTLSDEAILCADTFQAASESFLYYKRRDFKKAIFSMEQSIEYSRILNDDYNYAMIFRKAHLEKNLIKILSHTLGLSKTYLHSTEIFKNLLSDRNVLPFDNLSPWIRDYKIEDNEKWFCIDEITSEMASILIRMKHDKLSLPNILSLFEIKSGIHEQLRHWLFAFNAFLSDDIATFFKHSIFFFRRGVGYLKNIWSQLASILLLICEERNFPQKEFILDLPVPYYQNFPKNFIRSI